MRTFLIKQTVEGSLTHGSHEFRALLNLLMQPFCRDCTPIISLLADHRKSAMAVSVLTSSGAGRESSTGQKEGNAGRLGN